MFSTTIGRAMRHVPVDRILARTRCGIATMDRDVAAAKLRVQVAGACLAGERDA